MSHTRKWLHLGLALLVILLSFSVPTIHTKAASSSGSYFYSDNSNAKCDDYFCNANLYLTPKGDIYQVNTYNGKISFFDSKGKKKWTYTFEENLEVESMRTTYQTDSKGNFYVGLRKLNTREYYLASISSKGKLNWKFHIDQSYALGYGPSKPFISNDGTIYIGTGNPTDYVGPYHESYFYAISPTGKKKWSIKLQGDGRYSDITLNSSNDLVINTDADNSGVLNYTISLKGKIISSKKINYFNPQYDDNGNKYAFNYENDVLTVTDKKGKTLWTYKAKNYSNLEYVSNEGVAYISEDGYYVAVNKGKVQWKVKGYWGFIPDNRGLYLFDRQDIGDIGKGKTIIQLLDRKTGKIQNTKTVNFPTSMYVVHPKGFILLSQGANIYKVSLVPELSDPLKASQVKVVNNTGKSDTVTVSGLAKNDIIKVYSNKGALLASQKATSSKLVLSIKQIGKTAGKLYVTINHPGNAESSRVAISYSGEQSAKLTSKQVAVKNNKNNSDTITISKLLKGDIVTVYSSKSKLTSATAKASSLKISIKQLGKKAGTVYLTVKKAGMKESSKLAVHYKAE